MKTSTTASADLYRPQRATILKNEGVTATENYFLVEMESGRPLGHRPGQFVEVSVPGFGEAPISISSAPNGNGTFEMVVRKVGNVTGALHAAAAGSTIGIRGPFGTYFPVDGAMKGRDLLFVCGGIGLVPVRAAIQYVLANRKDYGAVTILFGSKSPAERLFIDETVQWSGAPDTTFLETVDRGDPAWTGNVGVITTLMSKVNLDPSRAVAVICGPPIMYKFVIIEFHKKGLPDANIYVSLERLMKCGVGKCGHCQIDGKYACQDGPVFRFSDVASLREAI